MVSVTVSARAVILMVNAALIIRSQPAYKLTGYGSSDLECPKTNLTAGAYPNFSLGRDGWWPCGFRYNVLWSVVQSCFAGDTVLSVSSSQTRTPSTT